MPIINRTGGGGSSLDFKITNASTLPGTVTDKTICIISSVAIGDSQITGGSPPSKQSDGVTSLVNGDVYIAVGTSSAGAFNVLKRGKIMLYPISAFQYNGTSWIAVTAYIGLSGSWVNFTHTFLYKRGTSYVTVTEGETSGGAVNPGASSISIVKTGGLSGSAYIDLPINFVGVTTVYVVYKTNSYTSAPRMLAMQGPSGDTALANVTLTSGVEAVASLDVSAIELAGRIRVGYWGDTGTWNIDAYEVYYK